MGDDQQTNAAHYNLPNWRWTTRRATPIPTHTTAIAMPSSQRPFFLSSFIAAFRPQGPSLQSTATSTPSQQPTKHTTTTAAASHANTPASSPAARSYSTTTHHNQQQPSRPLPIQQQSSRRRGSDSRSEWDHCFCTVQYAGHRTYGPWDRIGGDQGATNRLGTTAHTALRDCSFGIHSGIL